MGKFIMGLLERISLNWVSYRKLHYAPFFGFQFYSKGIFHRDIKPEVRLNLIRHNKLQLTLIPTIQLLYYVNIEHPIQRWQHQNCRFRVM